MVPLTAEALRSQNLKASRATQVMGMESLVLHHLATLLILPAEEVGRKTLGFQEEELQMLPELQGSKRFWLLKVLM